MPQFDITYLLVAGDRDRNLRYHAEVLAAAAHAGLRVETLVVETNARAHPDVRQVADRLLDVTRYPWIGPAHSAAYQNASAPLYLYTCNHHMTFRRPAWLAELVKPLLDGTAAASGDIRPQGFGPGALPGYERFDDSDGSLRFHLQGGVWAGRIEVLKHVPHDPRYPHGYEDVIRSWCIRERGERLVHVPTVWSTGVRGHVCDNDAAYSVIHDYRSES